MRVEQEVKKVLYETDGGGLSVVAADVQHGEDGGGRVKDQDDEIERDGRDRELAIFARDALNVGDERPDALSRAKYRDDENGVDDDHEREGHDRGAEEIEPVEEAIVTRRAEDDASH